MSPRTFRWVLFIVAILAMPLPMAGVETAWVPPCRMAMLGAIALAFVLSEGTGGVGVQMAVLFLAQAAFWGALCWFIAWGFARLLSAARPGFRQRIAFVLAAILLSIASLDAIYTTPYSAEGERATLLRVYR